ncbi:MAG: glycosyltransferase family 4 protein [Crocinitomicaceae bacterium]
MKHILFLYTEIADYFLSCAEYLAKDYQITIVRWPINKEAPFQFKENASLIMIEKKDNWSNVSAELSQQNFDLIIVSGWIDKDYMSFAKSARKKGVPTVLSLDNHWYGNIKQQIARVVAPFTLKKTFSHCWVPGKPQKEYALKLGFGADKIFENFYCANVNLFQSNFEKGQAEKYDPLKKKFIYVGRYLKHKGIFDLWEAFIQFRKSHPDWELHSVGFGDEWENRIEAEGITHHGFLQPDQLKEILNESTIFILPSHFEPWGVVVHENAISGFPMILSNHIGAGTKFLEEGKNGFTFESGNIQDLVEKMELMASKSNGELKEMGQFSHQLGLSIDFEKWSEAPRKILGDI